MMTDRHSLHNNLREVCGIGLRRFFIRLLEYTNKPHKQMLLYVDNKRNYKLSVYAYNYQQ